MANAKKQGLTILRSHFKQGLGWKIAYSTPKGGWAIHGLYKNWVWSRQEEVEGVIDDMVRSNPDLFVKD